MRNNILMKGLVFMLVFVLISTSSISCIRIALADNSIETIEQHNMIILNSGPTPPPGLREDYILGNSKSQIIIDGVPSYLWTNGCSPTAVGMIIGYYASHGYPDLIDGSPTSMMSSNGNWYDYCLPMDEPPSPILPDKSEPPPGDEHDNNCVADFIDTSQSYSGLHYGWSWPSRIGQGFTGYVNWKTNHEGFATYFDQITWGDFCNEINNNHPVVIDVMLDGRAGHSITAIGYDTSTGCYAYYNTWDHDIHWWPMSTIEDGWKFEIRGLKSPQISGPKTGYIYQTLNYSAHTIHSDGADIYYQFDWGDGNISEWLGPYPSGVKCNISHIWDEYGTYDFKARAKDDYNNISVWQDYPVIIISRPPQIPDVSGPDEGGLGVTYNFSVSSTDPEGDEVLYFIDWGDDSNSGWIGPYSSGESIVVNHAFWPDEDEPTLVTLTITAKDITGSESESISKEIYIVIPEFDMDITFSSTSFSMVFSNIGKYPVENLRWEIKADYVSIWLPGGILLPIGMWFRYNGEREGQINRVQPGDEITIISGPSFGIGFHRGCGYLHLVGPECHWQMYADAPAFLLLNRWVILN